MSYPRKILFCALVGGILIASGCSKSIKTTKVKVNKSHQTQKEDGHLVIYDFSSRSLRDSRWGKGAQLQSVLSKVVSSCGGSPLKPTGLLGSSTRTSLDQIKHCRQFPFDSSQGVVSVELWRQLAPRSPLPSVHERAFTLALSHEATDYDRAEWNFATADHRSMLTWGPYGATFGWGNEVGAILKRIHKKNPRLLPKIFSNEYSSLDQVLRSGPTQKYRLLKSIYQNPARRKKWKQAFAKLGAERLAREVYEAYALRSSFWLKPSMKRLYSLIPESSQRATEIDYAYFLDMAMHMSISSSRIQRTKAALHAKRQSLGRNLGPAERRQVISLNMIPKARRWDRLGRNVVYYVDEIGINRLSPKEKNAWKKRTGRRASQVGLSDQRLYYPDFL